MKPTATEDTVPQRMLHSTHEQHHVAVFVPSVPGSVRCTMYRGCTTLVDEHVSRREAIARWKALLAAGWQRSQRRERVKRQVPVPADAPAPGSLFRFFSEGIYLPVGLAEPRATADGRTRSVTLHLGIDGTPDDGAYVDVYTYVYLGTDKHSEIWSPTW